MIDPSRYFAKLMYKMPAPVLFAVSLLAHLPFLFAGYGREEDAWAQALNAKIIWETGVYEVSRLPGHPLYELLLAALWPIHHSYFFFNLLSASATSLAVVFFYKTARKLNLKSPFVLALALAFVPVVFIAGNYTIDYNFSLCFILASFYLLLKKKYAWAGVLLGIATGFRISSLGFLLPFSLMLFHQSEIKNWIRYWLVAGAAAFISFLPPLLTYGPDFLDFHKPPFASWASTLYELSFGIWGIPLVIALVILAGKLLFRKPRSFGRPGAKLSEKRLLWGIALIWIFQLLVFIRLPFKAEFFIPAVPFLLILCGMYLGPLHIRWLAGSAVLSCFFFGFDYTSPYRGSKPSAMALSFEAGGKEIFLDPLQGPAILDLKKRLNKSEFVDAVVQWQQQQKEPAWVISGWYWPEIMLKTSDTALVKFDYYSTQKELNKAADQGRAIYYLPEINEANANINAHYLADSLGQPLRIP